MRQSFLILIFCSLLMNLNAQQSKVAVFGFYNLENLFDTIDTKFVRDTEFTAKGSKSWDGEKYKEKIDNMSFVISKLGLDMDKNGVVGLGVSEIENKSVLVDLINHDRLKERNYGIVHYNSPDKRGIDVGFLYNQDRFQLIESSKHLLPIFRDGERVYTRDILLVSGIMDSDTFHILVNHWPSRRGGESASAPFRKKAAGICKHIVDSLYQDNSNAKIIVMGDFNDDPTNESVKNILNAKRKMKKVKKGGLYNPMYDLYRRGQGSNAYRDNWSLFDQILVNSSLFEKHSNGYYFIKAKVFNKKFLIQKTGRYKGYPFRTYAGGSYAGGYSDHFPTLIYLRRNNG